ncbi:MAG: DUF4398 domain-containing protein [Steroidobacteraceae bacterium]
MIARILTCGLLVAAIAGCASGPPPEESLAVARRSVERAEQAGATQAAPTELSEARNKLTAAEKAAATRDDKVALRLAQQADADGRVAEAAATAHRSHEAATQLDSSLQALREEAARGAGSAAPPPPPPPPPPND